jgi:hypothetical protein
MTATRSILQHLPYDLASRSGVVVPLAFDKSRYPILIDQKKIYGPQILSRRRVHDWHLAFNEHPSKTLAGTDLISGQEIQVAFKERLKFFIFIRARNSLQLLRSAILIHYIDVTQIDLANFVV